MKAASILLISISLVFWPRPVLAGPLSLKVEIYTDERYAEAGRPFYVFTRIMNISDKPLEFMLYHPLEHWEIDNPGLRFTELSVSKHIPAKIFLKPGDSILRDVRVMVPNDFSREGVKFRMRFKTKHKRNLFSDAASEWSNQVALIVRS